MKKKKSKKTKKVLSFEEKKFERDIWKENVTRVRRLAKTIRKNDYNIYKDQEDQEKLFYKICNRIEKTGYGSFEECIDLIIESDIFASYLAIDPRKQQPYQKRFFDLLSDLVSDDDTKSLVTANSRRVKDDRLFLNNNGEVSTVRRGDERDIDVILAHIVSYGREKVKYISHKRIGNQGSTQEDQFKEVKKFLKYAGKNNNPNESFVLAYEGDHFTDKKLEELSGYCKWSTVDIVEATDVGKITKLINV